MMRNLRSRLSYVQRCPQRDEKREIRLSNVATVRYDARGGKSASQIGCGRSRHPERRKIRLSDRTRPFPTPREAENPSLRWDAGVSDNPRGGKSASQIGRGRFRHPGDGKSDSHRLAGSIRTKARRPVHDSSFCQQMNHGVEDKPKMPLFWLEPCSQAKITAFLSLLANRSPCRLSPLLRPPGEATLMHLAQSRQQFVVDQAV